MPLFGKRPNLEEVRVQLIQFATQAQTQPRHHMLNLSQGKTKYTSYSEIDVQQAQKIITPDVAKLLNEKSGKQIDKFVSEAVLKSMPVGAVDFYLNALFETVERSFPYPNYVRFPIVYAGTIFHQERAEEYIQAKNLQEAEKELQAALDFAFRWDHPSSFLMVNLYYMGTVVYNQQRRDEANKYYNMSLDIYNHLSPDDKSEESLKAMADDMRQTLGKS